MSELTLISFPLCPYVQRAIIALEEKAVPYTLKHIDLSDKPAWFLAVSPMGKVPVLTVDDTPVFESAVIAEYLDEVYTPRLHPEAPLERARHRSWIEFSSTMLMDNWRLGAASTRDEAQPHIDALRTKLARLEEQLGEGPFFGGAHFGLVDASVAPLLQRLTWLEELAPELDLFGATPRIAAWRSAVLERPSVQRSTVEGGLQTFVAGLERYGSWFLTR